MLRCWTTNKAVKTESSSPDQGMDPPLDSDNSNNILYDVVIIGAGWAGLAAAKTLLREKGITNFRILEGRDYVGGRSRTVTLSDGTSTAELGSAWIHGTSTNNPVYLAAQTAGIETIRTTEKTRTWSNVHGGGGGNTTTAHRVPDREIDRLYEVNYWKGFFRFQQRRQDKTNNDESLRQTLNMYMQQNGISGDTRLGLEAVVDTSIVQEYAASLEDLSMWWWDTAYNDKGGDALVEQGIHKGYTALMDDLAGPFLDKILLNCNVTQVDYQDSTSIVVNYTQEGLDRAVRARNVIVTVPLGVLKHGDIKFIPSLPSEKQAAIDKLGMGVLNKVILKWPDNMTMPWPDDIEWVEKIASLGDQGNWTSFHNQKSFTGFNILTAFVAGQTAVEKELSSTDLELKNQAIASLKEMFTSKNVTTNIPEPEEYIVTRWFSDPFARGSYSYHALGSHPNHRDELRRPVFHRLFFAGEACHKGHPSTTHGAYLSGVEAARQIQFKDEEQPEASLTGSGSRRTKDG